MILFHIKKISWYKNKHFAPQCESDKIKFLLLQTINASLR
jgi:hypothetical protein